jgi:large subunit ribosomal protein L22
MAATISAPHARASARYLHVSAYKLRQVLDLIRGLSVEDAERVLELCQRDAADHVMAVLTSATANAEHNFQLPADELYVAIAYADEGPTRKWGQPRARGRYFRIRRRTSHLTLIVARFDEDELERRRRIDEASGRGAAAAQRRRAERVRKSRQRERRAAAAHDHDHDHDVVGADEPAFEEEATQAAEELAAAEGEYVDVEDALEETEAEAAEETQAEPTQEAQPESTSSSDEEPEEGK